MTGHSGAVQELHFNADDTFVLFYLGSVYLSLCIRRIYTASTDKTVGLWDLYVEF